MIIFKITGFLLLLFVIGMKITKIAMGKDKVRNHLPEILKTLTGFKPSLIITAVSLPLIFISQLLFIAEDGHNYYVQYPTGGYVVHTEVRGVTWKGFGKVTDWKDYVTVSSESEQGSGSFSPTSIRFSDKVTGTQKITVRFKLPDDPEAFRKLIKEFRTQENLINVTLISTVREVVSNSPYMFTGQGYASGEAPDYKFAVRDQLVNGTYVFKTVSRGSNIKPEKINPDSSKSVGTSYEGPIFIKKPQEDKNGKKMRIAHAITNSGITITQVTLPDVDFNKSFDVKLEEQRKQSALIQEYALKQRSAIELTKLVKVQGEKAKIMEQMSQEKAAVKQLIAVQTKLQKDSIELMRSRIINLKAKVDAKTLRINKDAEAYANRQLVNAGLTPLDRANIEMKTRIGIAAEIAKIKFPTNMTIIGAGGSKSGKGSLPLEALIGANMAKQLMIK